MHQRSGLAICALALFTAFSLGAARAQTAPMSPELAKIVDGAKKEGKLLLRSTTSVNGSADTAADSMPASSAPQAARLICPACIW